MEVRSLRRRYASMTEEDLVCLACCTRPRNCRPPSLDSSEKKGAYAKKAAANSKVCYFGTICDFLFF